jgi:hypothetical protein
MRQECTAVVNYFEHICVYRRGDDWKIRIPDIYTGHRVLGRARKLNLFPSLSRSLPSEKLKTSFPPHILQFESVIKLERICRYVNMKMVQRGVETCFGPLSLWVEGFWSCTSHRPVTWWLSQYSRATPPTTWLSQYSRASPCSHVSSDGLSHYSRAAPLRTYPSRDWLSHYSRASPLATCLSRDCRNIQTLHHYPRDWLSQCLRASPIATCLLGDWLSVHTQCPTSKPRSRHLIGCHNIHVLLH